MDFEDWEFLTDDGIFDFNHGDGREFSVDHTSFDQRGLDDANYFICPSPNSHRRLKPPPTSCTGSKLEVGKNPEIELEEEIKKAPVMEINLSSPAVLEKIRAPNLECPDGDSQPLNKMKETQFVDMKMDSQEPCNNRAITPQLEGKGDAETIEQKKGECFADHDIKEKDCCESSGFSIWKWRFTGFRAICSLGMAAGTIFIITLGQQKQKQQNQKLRSQIYTDDKSTKQAVQHATRLNQALSAVRGVPLNRAHIAFGGYYDGL